MRYYKLIEGNYITAIGTGAGGTEITEEEFERLRQNIMAMPTPEAGCGLRLTTVLTWEPYNLPPADNEELLDALALKIITGGTIE